MFTRYYITHAMTPVWITKYYWWTGGAGFSILILIQFTDIYTVKIKRQLCMWVSLIENKRPCRNQQQPNLIMINCTFGLPNLLANNLNMMCCIHQWMIRQCQQDKYQFQTLEAAEDTCKAKVWPSVKERPFCLWLLSIPIDIICLV